MDMFFTDPDITKRLEYLDQERKLLWEKITSLEEELSKKTSDYEESAKNSSEQAITYLNAIDVIKKSLDQISEESTKKIEEIRESAQSSSALEKEIVETSNATQEKVKNLESTITQIEERNKILTEKFAQIETLVENSADLEEEIKQLEEIFEKGNTTDTKINALYKEIADKKKEIEDLHLKIIGYKETEKDGTEIEVKGLKHELENSYLEIKSNLDVIGKDLKQIKADAETNYSQNLTNWNEKLSNIEKNIQDLLPKALTAGLSHAYSEKKDAEIDDYKAHAGTFNKAIWGLVGVSLIPFLFSIKSMYDGVALETIILRVPRLVLAILPLYIPVLWVAYSSNRRKNLSKRLIEEYSHKEVLSKTFEGLSRQIENIADGNISEDLRIKLLYNILEVNSENPGKLISDYNKTDHPLMDALDKSIKLSNAVTKLAKIPGFAKLAASLERKSKEILKTEGKKADAGIDSLTNQN
jgi:hypothetical protein